MRRKDKWWHNLTLIIPAMLVLPPLGFFMLWKSRRPPAHKIALSVVILTVMIVGLAAAVRMDLYERLVPPEIPATGFDVRIDDRGRYMNTRISEFERKVFNQVVHELRSKETWKRSVGEELTASNVFPELAAYEKVAEEQDLDVEDVQDIYMKVSLLLATKRK